MNNNFCKMCDNIDKEECSYCYMAVPGGCDATIMRPTEYKAKEQFILAINETKEDNDMVNHPNHYNAGGIECIDGLAAATAGLEGIEAFCTANAIKYLWRWKYKNGIQDLDKAIWYINRLKEELDKNS